MTRNFLFTFRSKKCFAGAFLLSIVGMCSVAFNRSNVSKNDIKNISTTIAESTSNEPEQTAEAAVVKFLPVKKNYEEVTSSAFAREDRVVTGSVQNINSRFSHSGDPYSQAIYYPARNRESQVPYYYPQQYYSTSAPQGPVFVPQRRLVHLDFKGAPPKLDYLAKLLPILVQLGATGLLIEYEDMFPYDGPLRSVPAKNHFTKNEVQELLAMASAQNLEVIPLVQTFGHLEFVLKLEQFSGLRENPDEAQAVCPSRNESPNLAELLIDQIIKLHPGIKYIHIGCDEVFQIAQCSLCYTKSKEELFVGHVTRIASYVRRKYNITPIIWDDMLRSLTLDELRESRLGSLVEPMVWVYAEDVYRFAPSHVFTMYSQVFPAIWGSSAYKGAFGETLVVPNIKRHLENTQNWLIVAREEGSKFQEGFRGLALAGWQRYDHFSALCELLPAGIPSLATNLLATSRGYLDDSLAPSLYDALKCIKSPKYQKLANLQFDPYLHEKMSFCSFPGVEYFRLTARFIRIEREIDRYVHQSTRFKGWLTDYNVRRNYSSGTRVAEVTRDLNYLSRALSDLARQVATALAPIFDANTVSEWLELKLLPLFQRLDRDRLAANQLRAVKTWKPRPLPVFTNWEYYGIRLDELLTSNKNKTRNNFTTNQSHY